MNTDWLEGHKRARTLLESFLSPEQLAALRMNGEFGLTGSCGGLYRIRIVDGCCLVSRLLDRDVREGFCVHLWADDQFGPSRYPWPAGDQALGYALAIATDERGFLSTANSEGRYY